MIREEGASEVWPPLQLSFVLQPVRDVAAAVGPYLACGFRVCGWPDGETVVLSAPGSEWADLMLEDNAFEAAWPAGPVFRVASVDEWHRAHGDVAWVLMPTTIPVGRYAAVRTGSHLLRIFDTSGGGPLAALFR